MPTVIDNYKENFEKAITHLKDDLSTLRVGRANPVIVQNIVVEAYGAKTPLLQLASVTVPEARTLVIQPWDKSIIKDIERAIIAADIGIAPVNEGQQIRLTVPQLTEEGRLKLTKSVAEKEEQARIAVRGVRDKAKDDILAQEKANAITEDDRFTLIKKLDETVKEYNELIKTIAEKKRQEIMTI